MDLPLSAADLLNRKASQLAELVDVSDARVAHSVVNVLIEQGRAAMKSFGTENRQVVDHVSSFLVGLEGDVCLEERLEFLCASCFYYDRIGRSYQGVSRGERARELAAEHGLKGLERRACNGLAIAYMGCADFELACRRLERSLVIAEELGDPFLVCNAFSQATALLMEMGLYRDAMEVADKVAAFKIGSAEARHVQFNAVGNGLFCAHRLGDEAAALRYMSQGSELLDQPRIDATSRASFEYYRVLHLLAQRDFETAELLLNAARQRLGSLTNPRVEILLGLADAMCDWASEDTSRRTNAKKRLRELYHRSKQLGVQHDDVLRALTQVYSNCKSTEEAQLGMTYAKELVEYVTNVKRAKFYRQLMDRGVEVNLHPSPPQAVDPLSSAKQWLGLSKPVAEPSASTLRKHDELFAVHDDLARMRTAQMRSSMRTVAYGTAENWALAAEFFDDETGQHCYRVGYLAGLLAREIGMDEEFCIRVEHAARLHDIGKIGINELILLKPGPLDPAEIAAMRAHSEVGAFLLEGSVDPTLQMAGLIARYHHEWWNGAGYPNALVGSAIPLPARICALADVYDALTNKRSYKSAWPHRMAVEQILNEGPIHFDPDLLSPFLKVLERYVPILTNGKLGELAKREMGHNDLLVSRERLMRTVRTVSE
jgi:HD-GYP domain-containing protein (c-di-GMP phosphodiesterase class II)